MNTISLSLTVFEIFDFKFFRVWPWLLTPKGHLGSKNFILFESPYMTSFLTSMDTISLSLTVFEIFDFKIFWVWPWSMTPEGHLGSKNFILFESSYMTSYLTSMDTISLSLTVFKIFDFKIFRVWPWPLTPKGHLGTKNVMLFEILYMTSYLTPMDTISLPLIVFEIFDSKIFRVWPWPLTPKGHLMAKNSILFESPYMTPYLTSRDIISLFLTVFEIFEFKIFIVWPRPLTPEGHLRSENFILFESLCTISYLTSMDTISLSLTVFEIFEFKIFMVRPGLLTPKNHLGSKNFILFESPCMTSYLTSMDTISLSFTVFEIFDFKTFRDWPWPSTPKGQLGAENFILFESLYTTPYLTPMDTISLSLTVFEIFDCKIFRVWPWPLTPEGHLWARDFILLESPYMTPYLTSMDIISPSFTVFEIFDFKNFRVWPWPLTPEGHLGSKNFILFESQYMIAYLTSMNTISLSLTVFEIFDFKIFRVWPWLLTPKGHHLGSRTLYTVRKPIYDFLFDFYEQHLSISYRFRDIRIRNLSGLTLTFDPWWSSGVEKCYTVRKPMYDFQFDFYDHHLSISYRFRDIRLQNF